jgi:hypothetical protein
VNDGLEFLVVKVIDRPGMPRAPEDTDIGSRNIVEVFLVADRRKKLGFVENTQEFRKSKNAPNRSISCLAACAVPVRSRMKRTMSIPIFGSS